MTMLKLHHLVEDKVHARSTVRTAWSRSSLLAAKPNSAGSVLVKWRYGLLKRMGLHTPCKNADRKIDDVQGESRPMKQLLKVNRSKSQAYRLPSGLGQRAAEPWLAVEAVTDTGEVINSGKTKSGRVRRS